MEKLPAYFDLTGMSVEKRSKTAWRVWGEKKLTKAEKALGWKVIIGEFNCPKRGKYFCVNFAAMPTNPKGFKNSLLGVG